MAKITKFPTNPELHRTIKEALDTGVVTCLMVWVDEDDNIFVTHGGGHDYSELMAVLSEVVETIDD